MPSILYLTRLPRLVNLGQVELVGPVDQALVRLLIVHLEGRGGCRLRFYYCARLRLGSGSGSGQCGGGFASGGAAGYMAAAGRLVFI